MQPYPLRTSPLVNAITTFAERRWISQDAARVNAARAASRLRLQRRQLDEVDNFLAAEGPPQQGSAGPENESEQVRRTTSLPP